jgi:hypothetical protein
VLDGIINCVPLDFREWSTSLSGRGERESSTIWPAVFRAGGQASIGPSGVFEQVKPRMRLPI